eukprot:Hpha_TRINITY_DN10961_c0_g1::TRINITY_DN10961_c0_g1_i1::g.26934::m.26934
MRAAVVLLALTTGVHANSPLPSASYPEKSEQELRGLLESYNPVVWQHPGGLFYPVDVEDMMRSTNYPLDVSRQCLQTGKVHLIYSTTNTTTLKEAPETGRLLAVAGQTSAGFALTYFAFYHYDVGSRFVQTFDKYGDWEYVQIMLEWKVDSTSEVQYLSPVSLRTESHGNGWLLAWNDPNLLLATGSGVDERGNPIQRPQVFAARDSHGFYPNPTLKLSVYPTDPADTNRMCDESTLDPTNAVDLLARRFCDYVAGAADGGISTTFSIDPLLITRADGGSVGFSYIDTGSRSGPVVYLAEEGENCNNSGTLPKYGPSYRWGNPTNAHGHASSPSTNPRHKSHLWDAIVPYTAPPTSGAMTKGMGGAVVAVAGVLGALLLL